MAKKLSTAATKYPLEQGHEDLGNFLAQQEVEITASLPCYSQDNVDKQRGKGVLTRALKVCSLSITWATAMPRVLFNFISSTIRVELFFRRTKSVEASYKDKLFQDFGIVFNQLFTITNLPISRFRGSLERSGDLPGYMKLLEENYNQSTLDHLMCRSQISIGWQGHLYDCDFNQMLEMPTFVVGSNQPTVWDIESFDELSSGPIAVENHCYGCTAGSGSSCGGALAKPTACPKVNVVSSSAARLSIAQRLPDNFSESIQN